MEEKPRLIKNSLLKILEPEDPTEELNRKVISEIYSLYPLERNKNLSSLFKWINDGVLIDIMHFRNNYLQYNMIPIKAEKIKEGLKNDRDMMFFCNFKDCIKKYKYSEKNIMLNFCLNAEKQNPDIIFVKIEHLIEV